MRRALTLLLLAASLTACRGGGDRPRVADRATTSTTAAIPTTTTTTLPVATRPSCPATPPRAAPAQDRPRYTLRVDLRPAESAASGDVSVRFVPDLPTDRLVFRLWPNGPRITAGGGRLDAGPVTVDGGQARSEFPNPTTLVVPLGRMVPAGTAIQASMPWQLRIPGPIDDRVAKSGSGVRLGSFFPILPWEPGVGWALDPPSTAYAEAFTAPAADFTMSVTAPPGYTVLASGASDDRGTWTGIGMREVALSAGRFRVVEATANAPGPIPVTVGVDEDLGSSGQAFADKVVRSIEQFSRRYGPYPWPEYTLAITGALRGGVEFPGHVMQGPGTIGRTTSHEVAHQWFYALVGNNQARDPWIDEGLATWGEWQYEGVVASGKATSIPASVRGRAGEPMSFWDPQRKPVFARGVRPGREGPRRARGLRPRRLRAARPRRDQRLQDRPPRRRHPGAVSRLP